MAKPKKSKVVGVQSDGTEIHGFDASKSIESTHGFGVPFADDEAPASDAVSVTSDKIKEFYNGKPESEKKKATKNDIEKHPKFGKFKGREINGNE